MNDSSENNLNQKTGGNNYNDALQNPVLTSRDYKARLTEFEGPMDILLHFVKVDIWTSITFLLQDHKRFS